MSANSGPLASTKGDSASKPSKASYDHLDINKLYKGKTSETVTKTVAQKHGMQALGKALPARRPGQVGSLKTENSNEGSNSLSGSHHPSNAVGPSNNQAHLSQHQPPGWTGNAPPPQASSSPRPAQVAQGTGQNHPQDKSWSGGSDRRGTYPSQRFAQEFPSLDSGMDAKNTSGTQNSGPGSSSQGPQSMAKGQDNQYGPGPVLRPQTEGSWIQGGGRGIRPGPNDFAPLNAPSREYQGPDRGSMGGPTPPPMSLGQGGPNSQQMAGYPVPPFRGIMPGAPFMFPNGPPPGPGVFYHGMPRFVGMPVPPSPPRPQMNNNHGSDLSRDRDQNRGGNRGPPAQRPSSHFANKPIIKDEDLKRMDEIGVQDGGWASVQDDVDYSKTISFGSDEDEGKGDTVPSSKAPVKVSSSKSINSSSRTEIRKDDRDTERSEDSMTKLENRIPERRPKILERQQSSNANPGSVDLEDRRQRDGNDRDVRDRGQRLDSGANKDARSRESNAYKYEQGEDDRKPSQNQGFPPVQQHAAFRRPPYEEKNRDPRDDRRANIDRNGRRPTDRRDEPVDNWRSVPPRQQYEEDRKGSQPRSDVRNPDPREFAGKPHMSNLPPRLLRQQYQTGSPANPHAPPQQVGANQRQTPSPGATTGKDKDSPRSEWEPEQERSNQDRRRIEPDYSRGKREGGRDRRNYDYDSRYGNDQHRDSCGYKENEASVASPPNRSSDAGPNSKSNDYESPEGGKKSDDSKSYGSSKSKMSWADEMDDDENLSSVDDLRSSKSKPGSDMRINQQFSKPDYYQQKSEERQKRVIIAKHQRKVADMQSEKVEPPKEVKQQSPPAVSQTQVEPRKVEEPQEKTKPVSAWGDRDSREKILKSDKESPRGNFETAQKDGGEREDRRSMERDNSGALQKSSSSSSVPGRNKDDFGNEGSPADRSKSSGKYSTYRADSEVQSTRSGSVSDISDRDHLDRESVGSQDNRSKRGPNFKPSNQDRPSRHVENDSTEKPKPRLNERDRREKTNSERDGSEDGSLNDRNARGGRQQNRYPVYNARGGHNRQQWDRPGNRGRGRGGSHYYDKPQRRSESERDPNVNDDRESNRAERHESEVQVKEERRQENTDSSNGPLQDSRKEENSQDEAEAQRGPRKERDGDNQTRKKGNMSSKRGGGSAGGNAGNQRSANKIEGYGPPSDQKPFSNPGSKASDEESGKPKDKTGESNQAGAVGVAQKDNAIPSLMAFDISPPTMAQFKKGQREREFHPRERENARAVPPRLQRGPGGEYNERERDRFSNRGGKRGGKSNASGGTGPKKDGEESEEWSDNESDNDSRKSGGASNKNNKDSAGGYQQVKKKSAPQKAAQSEKNFDPSVGAAPGKAARGSGSEKKEKAKQVKYPPYDARSAQSQLPPRLAKQRDSQGPPSSNPPGVPSNGNAVPSKESSSQPAKGVEPAAPPATNAWEKPIASAFRPEKAVGHNSKSPMSSEPSSEGKEPGNDLKISGNQIPPSSNSPSIASPAAATTVLDGTNPPSQTMIFENRNFKGGFSDVGSKSSVSKLPETKKDVLSNIDSGKGLVSLGFGKGRGEGSPELDFGSFEESGNASQTQSSGSMMTGHSGSSKQSTANSILQQQARHAFEHQSPISPCAAELTEKIQQVKKVWETPSMAAVSEHSGVFGGLEDGPFHNAFGSETFKTADSGRGDFGPSSLQQGGGGYSGGSSPSLSAIAKPESSSSPNSANSRQVTYYSNKPGQQQPPIAKAPGHQTLPTPFNNYGIETQHPIGTKNFGNIPVVASKIMFPSNVPITLDPFGSQYTQYQNPGPGVIPFSQGGSVMIRPGESKSMYPTMYGQPQVTGVGSQNMGGHGQNHNSVSPAPATSSGNIGSNGGAPGNSVHMNARSNMVQKPSQQNRNQSLQGTHPSYYHSHHNTLPQQQMHKGGFGPSNGGYSDGSLSAYQPQPPIIIPVQDTMYNLGANFDSSDLRSGPTGPVPPGTPPVQSSSNYYFGTNNNPIVYPQSTQSQNYGHPFGPSLKLSGFNSGSGSSDGGSNLSSQRIRDHQYMHGSIPAGHEPLPQNPMKSGHDFVLRQQSWSHGNEFVQQMQWNPSPIQRPIYPQSTAQVMPNIVPSSHYMQGPGGPGHVGGKPQNQSNDSMGNNPG